MNKPIIAKLNHMRIAPRKTRFVADLIRGLSVNEAQAQLMISSRRPSPELLKLLKSAIANAVNNSKLDPANLFIKEIRVDQAPKLVRYWPRARGSMGKIEKKASHVTLVLGISDKLKKPKFTIVPKPKKTKHESAKKSESSKHKHAGETHEKSPKIDKGAPVKPAKEGGTNVFKRFFRRKSI